MPAELDVSALRSLAAIADCGGYHRAAQALHLSQSTVSQHVRKLETVLGRPLLERDGRRMRFTPDGEIVLAESRRLLAGHDELLGRFAAADPSTIVIGSTEHAAEQLLPHIGAALAADLPDARVRFRLDRGRRLADGLERGTVTAAVLLGQGPAGDIAGVLPLGWYAAPGWSAPRPPRPIPLVAIDDPCTIRRHALQALADGGRRHEIVAESGYLAGVVNAVRAGVGVALLAHPGPPPEGLELRTDLPGVEPEPLHVRAAKGAPAGLAALVARAVAEALAAPA